ncbi:MBL fold metallo-hydrolase [Streptomyces zingiberis]|uniref:MBL fold metallo-hydrolase n=1 Tax=Streptomyces zingiberis TaxID=2053010 RepID=A0ABX1BUG1_9ACTN|nr:MBL fold metallo-hydrolase [Streptomyces zingiberis]NJQ00185.1 MBL fold metallo-hydrolase [Streptomyces zingiberis]
MNAIGQAGPALPGCRLLEVADGVHAWVQPDGTWWINNAGCVAGGTSVLVVDTCTTERRTRAFLDAVTAAHPSRSLEFAVNTHHHGDHTYGNSLLPGSTRLIGHENMRAGLLKDTTLGSFPGFWEPTPEFGDLTLRAPELTISSGMSIHLGDRRIELLHPGYTAHTDGDVIVWIPDVRVVFTGDLLFPGHTPMIMVGSPSGAIDCLGWMASLRPAVVVPGHGEVLDAAGFAETLAEHERYYRFVLAESRRGLAEGLTPLGVARSADLSDWTHLLDPERFVLNVHAAYAELNGVPVVRSAALADAVAWLGHPIVTRV